MISPAEDDDLDPLPPMDDDGTPGGEGDAADGDDEPLAGEASLDDATGEDDPVDDEVDVDERETGWVDEPADAEGMDFGEPDLDEAVAETLAAGDAEAPGVGDEDFGLGDAERGGSNLAGLDGGEEGPLDADEDLRDADLPPLDADDEGEAGDAMHDDLAIPGDDPAQLPWAAAPWRRVGAPLPLTHATAVTAGASVLVAARDESGKARLARVDLEGDVTALEARGLAAEDVRALASRGPAIAALVEGGGVLVSSDAGASFATAEGAPLELAGLARQVAGPDASELSDAALPPVSARRGGVAVFAASGGGVLIDRGDGVPTHHAWPGAVTAITLLDDAGTLAAATYSEAEDATSIVRLDARGVPEVVARLDAPRADPDAEGRVASLAFDETRAVVWVAGAAGVVALSID